MIELSVLRVAAPEGLTFACEKLRAGLVMAGLRHVFAGEIATVLSQSLRDRLPAQLTVALDDDSRHILLQPPEVAGRYQRIALSRPPDDASIQGIRAILNRLTREELLYDLELQVQQRTADLEHERERSERLLRNMLPDLIARRMKNGETIADTHEASVLFADIVGFTRLARQRSAQAIVMILDRIFREFDAIAQKRGLEKIKTIGDSYMAAAGLPVAQMDHVDRAVLMGLEMIAAMPALCAELDLDIDVRVGVHTGPVLAGVIGTKKYAYDIWGDTVNLASRMESHGMPGRLQISEDVRKALGKRYELEDRGIIEIKNHVPLQTWFVKGIIPIGIT